MVGEVEGWLITGVNGEHVRLAGHFREDLRAHVGFTLPSNLLRAALGGGLNLESRWSPVHVFGQN